MGRLLFLTLMLCTGVLRSASGVPNLQDRRQEALVDKILEGVKDLAREAHEGRPLSRERVLEAMPEEAVALADHARRYFTFQAKENKVDPGTFTIGHLKLNRCLACTKGASLLGLAVNIGYPSATALIDTAIAICSLALEEEVCEGAVNSYAPEVLHLVGSKGFDNGAFCNLAIGGKCGAWEDMYNWDVEFPFEADPKPEFQPPTPPEEGSRTMKVLHLADVHLDLSYKVGTDKECGLPTCCSNTSAMAEDPSRAAGYWGSRTCDLPLWTLEDMLSHITEQHSGIDYVILTGDHPGHNVWKQSREKNLQHSKTVISTVKKYFPGTPVVMTLGNHDSFPCNSYPPNTIQDPEWKTSWLYEALADDLDHWLPDEANEQFRENGRFTFLLKPGFRIISMNSNTQIGGNFWLSLDYKDPNGDLLWLHDTLLAAEKAGEKVHIVSHSPLPSIGVTGWTRNYLKLVDRFANTIAAQFFGHTHFEEFTVFYDQATNSVPVNIGFVTLSAAPYGERNPGYKIFTLDGHYEGASMRVIEGQTYVFDLDEANDRGESVRPNYYQMYDYKKDLEMRNLFPADFDLLVRRMAEDSELFQKFSRYYHSDVEGLETSQRSLICSMVSPLSLDDRKCVEIMGPAN